jgi:hypothetical protein
MLDDLLGFFIDGALNATAAHGTCDVTRRCAYHLGTEGT